MLGEVVSSPSSTIVRLLCPLTSRGGDVVGGRGALGGDDSGTAGATAPSADLAFDAGDVDDDGGVVVVSLYAETIVGRKKSMKVCEAPTGEHCMSRKYSANCTKKKRRIRFDFQIFGCKTQTITLPFHSASQA